MRYLRIIHAGKETTLTGYDSSKLFAPGHNGFLPFQERILSMWAVFPENFNSI
jgi:hypothetical protein